MGLHLFRISVESETTLTAMFTGPLRAGAPTTLGAIGTEQATGERVWLVAFEWPEAYTPLADKAAKEMQHLKRFIADVRVGTGSAPYHAIAAGPNPPDFLCSTRAGDQLGVEVSQLVSEPRAKADAQFRPFRYAVLGTDRNRFRHLHGRVVYVSFDTPDGRPPKGPAAAKQLIRVLEGYSPTDFDLTELPDPAPPGVVTPFPGGTLVSARLEHDTGSPFSRIAGWEIVFAQPATIRQEAAWNRFCELIAQHDCEGVDDIIVSAQAPTVTGVAYPSDGAAAQAVLTQGLSTSTVTKFIRRIYVHIWSTRCVFALAPGRAGVEQICGELPLRIDER